MRISACMIVKNEEEVISRCIKSYYEAVDEIIVVDTGSKDRTVEIAKKNGARVYYFAWQDDFAAAKNFALSKAKGDWIIFLDADEYFANHTGNNIRSFLLNLDESFNSVACKMLNLDQSSGKLLDEITHIRIFKNDKYIRYVNPIHEMLLNRGKSKKMNAFLADTRDIVIHHTGYSYDNRQQKAKRNLELLLRELPKAPEKPAYYQYIADCYFGLENWEKVIEYTNLFMNSGTKMVGYNVRPHQNLIDAMLKLKHSSEDIMDQIDIAIKKYPYHPLFVFYKANLLYDLKKYDAAFYQYQLALNLHEKYDALEINSLPTNLWMVKNAMGAISEQRNNYGEAVEYYLESLKMDNKNSQCFDRLIMLIHTQPEQEIILFINTLYNLEDEADLEFLATRFLNHAMPKVLAYYTNLREKRFSKKDFIVLQMLVANGYYDKAFPTLLDCYIQDRDGSLATVIATAALLSNNEKYINCCLENLPESLIKIIKSYLGEDVVFTEQDSLSYLMLVRTFTFWGSDAALENLLSLESLFPGSIKTELGSAFINMGYYQIALQFYGNSVNELLESRQPVSSGLYYKYGYCLHRTENYQEAAKAFVEAYEYGYRSHDIYEFLRWSFSKIDVENSLTQKIKDILQDKVEIGKG